MTDRPVMELRGGDVVRPAGAAKHTPYKTVQQVQPGREPNLVEIYFQGEGGRVRVVPANKRYEFKPESLAVLKSERTTIDVYHLRQRITVTVLRGRGAEEITTNAIRVTCKFGKSIAEVWWEGPDRYLKVTEAQEKDLLERLGVSC